MARLAVVGALVAGCAPEDAWVYEPTSAHPDDALDGKGDLVASEWGALQLPRCETTEPDGVVEVPRAPSTLVATLLPRHAPLVERDKWRNPSDWSAEKHYRDLGYMAFDVGPGAPAVRRTELGDTEAPMGERRSLAYFVHLSDFQILDDESPARVTTFDSQRFASAMRPQEAGIGLAVSAMNRTLARIMRAERPYDFGIVTGDCTDSAQYNELRWMLAIMRGDADVHMDSGVDDDPVPGPMNDPKDPFAAATFPAPWLYVFGNHDALIQGGFAWGVVQQIGNTGLWGPVGTRHYEWWFAPGLIGPLMPDGDRRAVTRAETVAELVNDASPWGPPGHGFGANADLSLGAHYVHDAVPGLLRIVSLDTTQPSGDPDGVVTRDTAEGFLRPALEQAEADGVLVLLASHHGTAKFAGDYVGRPGYLSPAEVEALVAGYPAVIGWLAGHEHAHRIRAVRAPGATGGYWEIQTGGMMDWPSQTRILELVDNGNGTLSILGTLIDFDAETCLERRFRRLAMLDHVSGWAEQFPPAEHAGNVELVLPIPPSAAARVSDAAARSPTRLETSTTLLGLSD